MRCHTSNQQGFSAVEAIIIIVVIAILGLAGWFVWHSQKKDTASSTQTTTNSTNDNATNSSVTDTRLVIKEWGVAVTVPADLKNASYEVKDDIATMNSDAQKAVTNCSEVNVQTAWGIKRFAAGKVTAADGSAMTDAQASANPAFIHIGDSFYQRVYPTAGCESASDQMKAIDAAYAASFKTLEDISSCANEPELSATCAKKMGVE